MVNAEKQLHVRLTTDVYRELKIKCASELISLQDYLSNLVKMKLANDSQKNQTEEEILGYNKSYILELLQCSPLFSGASQNDLVKLANASILQHFSKGESIIREGDMPNSYDIIIKGSAKISKISLSGKEFTIFIRKASESIGQTSVILGKSYIASAIALEESDILSIEREEFLNFLAQNTIVSSRIVHLDMERKCQLFETLIDMSSSNATQRVIKTLFKLTSIHGTILQLTHQDIATMSWTTMETVTRVINKLKNADIITVGRSRIIIKKPEQLLIYLENHKPS